MLCYSHGDCGGMRIVRGSYEMRRTRFEKCWSYPVIMIKESVCLGNGSVNDLSDLEIHQCFPMKYVCGDSGYAIFML